MNYREVETKVKELRESANKLERTMLELLAHPDATTEQIMAARTMYLDMKTRIRWANAKLEKASHGWWRSIKI